MALQAWSKDLTFTTDAAGAEELLDAAGTQVMMEWERPYMVACVDSLELTGESDVLEVGFGCGYSATRIQQAGPPRTHTIIECSPVVLERCRRWAAGHAGVIIVEGTWQARLPELPRFDAVFFDDFGQPALSEAEMRECPDESYREAYAASRSHVRACPACPRCQPCAWPTQ